MPEGKKIAILTECGFEQVELTSPKEALEQAGFTVHVVSPQSASVRAWNQKEWGIEIPVDVMLDQADADQYDGLMLPGGVMNPDKLRMNAAAVSFARQFMTTRKPVAAICHGPQLLIETGELYGRRMTSYPSVRTDLKNAGVDWVDERVVVDGGLVTSRTPDDLPAFNQKMIEEFQEGAH